jgi:hypothetical protein
VVEVVEVVAEIIVMDNLTPVILAMQAPPMVDMGKAKVVATVQVVEVVEVDN